MTVQSVKTTLTEEQVGSILRDFESRHSLFLLTIDGVSIWRLLRFPVGLSLQNLPLEKRKRLSRRGVVLFFVLNLFKLLLIIVRRKNYEYVVKTYSSGLRKKVGNKYRDIHFDDILDALPGGMKISFRNTEGYLYQERNSDIPPKFNTVAVSISASILSRLFPRKSENNKFDHLSHLIAEELGIDCFSSAVIQRIFSNFMWQGRIYSLLLRSLKPKAVLVSDTGELALSWAASKNQINFIELQHGIFSKDHPDSLPYLSSIKPKYLLLPSFMAVYGDYWKGLLRDTFLGQTNRLVSVGASAIDHYRVIRAQHYKPAIDCPVLTLSTQGLDKEGLVNFLGEFLAICNAKFLLQVKLHPAYDNSQDYYLEALGHDNRIKIISGKSFPNTYDLIALSDMHLSIASACHFDALGLGVPTVVIGLSGYQLMSDILKAGDAQLVMTPVELSRIIQERSWGEVSENKMSYYFASGFIGNMQKLIER